MRDLTIISPYLEKLSTEELISLAENFKIRTAHENDRNSIIESLIDFAPCLKLYQNSEKKANNAQETDPLNINKTASSKFQVPALPKLYNMTYIDVLVRDPFWIFAVWEVNSIDKKRFEKIENFNGYMLKIRLNKGRAGSRADFLHMARISEHDSTRYINFPPEISYREPSKSLRDYSFIVDLCALGKTKTQIIVSSRPFIMPKSMPAFGSSEEENLLKPSLKLSGIENMKIPRDAL